VRRADAQALAAACASIVIHCSDSLFHCDGLIRTVLPAGLAAEAYIGIEDGLGRVLLRLSPGRSATHAQILYGASKSSRQVSLEVRDNNQTICAGHLSCDRNPLKMLFVYLNFPAAIAFQSIGNDNRRAGNSVAKTVLRGGLQVIDCIGAASPVKCIGVGEEWLCSQSPYPVCYRPDENGIYIRVVSPLTEVDLSSYSSRY
jgi:hypothetical protein